MTKVPILGYKKVIRGRCNATGGVIVRQKGSHTRLQKHQLAETLKLTLPAHRPLKRSTLSHILKQARLSVEEILKLVQ
jgi:predicted RNA binding protein YcfA (HicA-like mRNA interferase family)